MLGCGWAKRSVVHGFILGWVAPMVVAAVWAVMAMALMGIHVMAQELVPKLAGSVEAVFADWPQWAVFLLNPATLLTAAMFVLYCVIERGNTGIASGYVERGNGMRGQNVFSRVHRH